MYHTDTSKTGFAFIGGLILGGLAIFALPERHREKLKQVAMTASTTLNDWLNVDERADRILDIFNENTAKARAIYEETRRSLATTLTDLGEKLENLDKNKYNELVEDTVDYIQEHHSLPNKTADKLRSYLQSDFNRLTALM